MVSAMSIQTDLGMPLMGGGGGGGKSRRMAGKWKGVGGVGGANKWGWGEGWWLYMSGSP